MLQVIVNLKKLKEFAFHLNKFVRSLHVPRPLLNEPKVVSVSEETLCTELTKEQKFQEIKDEIEMWKKDGKLIPSELKPEYVEELLTCPTRCQRLKLLTYLFKKEAKRRSRLAKIESVEKEKNGVPESITRSKRTTNPLFIPIAKELIKQKTFLNRRIHAILFGQKFVVDLSYDENMWRVDSKNCAHQLNVLRSVNKAHAYPFNLYFCNVNKESLTMKTLHTHIDNNHPDLFVNYTHSSYLDIFPKENLVYLSPHAEESLKEYDHEAIYIIGGLVDRSFVGNLSYEKAKKEGIKSYSLPLQEYVKWRHGSKNLALDQMIRIMLELKTSGDWKKALQFLPSRKINKFIHTQG